MDPQRGNGVYSIPGKVFILGEYAVLGGAPALVAAVGPRFRMRVEESADAADFQENSPVGRLLEWGKRVGAPSRVYRFDDPYEGRGGFGASTAQFALAYFDLANRSERDPGKAWKLYRELTSDFELPPSGADLVAQWNGGVSLFRFNDFEMSLKANDFDWTRLLVFSATSKRGRKTATHAHLEALGRSPFPTSLMRTLEKIVSQGIVAIEDNDPAAFGKALDDYAEAVGREGLEHPGAREDRLELRQLPGVLGAKGSGAMLSDSLLVLAASEDAKDDVVARAEEIGLELVADGIHPQPGIQLDS